MQLSQPTPFFLHSNKVNAMVQTALTKDRRVLAHVKPFNVRIWIMDSSAWDVLSTDRWAVGMSDYNGAIVYDFKQWTLADMRGVNEEGAIIFQTLMADPRGGALTISGFRIGSV